MTKLKPSCLHIKESWQKGVLDILKAPSAFLCELMKTLQPKILHVIVTASLWYVATSCCEVSQSIVHCPHKCSMFMLQMNSQHAMFYWESLDLTCLNLQQQWIAMLSWSASADWHFSGIFPCTISTQKNQQIIDMKWLLTLPSNQGKASAISVCPIKCNSSIYFSLSVLPLTWSFLLKERRMFT